MPEIQEIFVKGYEKVIEATDSSSGLKCFIAIHNTLLGPAMGGARIYPYASRNDALTDVLRLAKAMTYKSAMAEDGLGGGKSVIIADPKKEKSEKLLLSFAEVIHSLKGSYIAAEDVGTTTEDMTIIRKRTPYVAALPSEKSSGDPSRFTAWGVFKGLQAVAQTLWNHPSLRGKKILIQGIGSVGSKLAHILFWEGADLIVCDVDSAKTHEIEILYGATVIPPDQYAAIPCDIFSPCSLGGILNSETISKFSCKAIAGSANNQLLDLSHGLELQRRNILYAPDYVINAGGIINAAAEFDPEGYNPKIARDKVNHIYDTLMDLFKKSKKENKSSSQVADEIAEYKLAHLIGKRQHPIRF